MTQSAIDLYCLLAARQDLHRVWGRFDHGRPSDGTSQLLVLVGMAAILVVVMLIWFRATRRPHRHFITNSAGRLFRELCRAHGLSYSTRRLLKQLSAARGLPSPALLFVEPKHFDPSTLPATLQPAARDLQHLRAQLFA